MYRVCPSRGTGPESLSLELSCTVAPLFEWDPRNSLFYRVSAAVGHVLQSVLPRRLVQLFSTGNSSGKRKLDPEVEVEVEIKTETQRRKSIV